MAYERIIDWIERRISSRYQTALDDYDFFNEDTTREFWEDFVRNEDDDSGRLNKFFFGNNRYTKEYPNFKWKGIYGPQGSVAKTELNRIEDPLIEQFNQRIEERLRREIETADTTEDVSKVEIPDALIPETAERLEGVKTGRFGELRGQELEREIADPLTDISELKKFRREVKTLPDEVIRRNLEISISQEQKRTKDLNQFFLENIRELNTEQAMSGLIERIRDSDLRPKQKIGLLKVADARKEMGFPELGNQ